MTKAGLARDTLEGLRRAERDEQHQRSLAWLSSHRLKYAGQWIALRGDHLVAVGPTAKEVFTQVRGENPPALVIKIESETLPFAGW
jgi:hypothetical protein